MTPEEREHILNVVATADGGCSGCVRGLIEGLSKVLPNEPWAESFGPVDYDVIGRRKKVVERLLWPNSFDDEDTENGGDGCPK